MRIHWDDTVKHGTYRFFNRLWVQSQYERVLSRRQVELSQASKHAKKIQEEIRCKKLCLTELIQKPDVRVTQEWRSVGEVVESLESFRYRLHKVNNRIRKLKKQIRG